MTHKVCDALTEAMIYFSVIFSPWAFGTTQSWSVWTMNIVCYVLGGTLMAKWLIRWGAGYKPNRWGDAKEEGGIRMEESEHRIIQYFTAILAALTVLILAYCFVSAWNARATFYGHENRFEYYDYIEWLPHSYDRPSTIALFWQYLGLAFFFWAARDWLLTKTRNDRRELKGDRSEMSVGSRPRLHESEGFEIEAERSASRLAVGNPAVASQISTIPRPHTMTLPARLRRLLWVVCINGAIIALEGILQRLSGTNKLLWLIVPHLNSNTEAQFGPYAYRSNAATYLNLVWPVCLGFWLVLRKVSSKMKPAAERIGGGSYMVLLPCAVVMASAPIISTSRGGALVALASIPIASAIVFFSARREKAAVRAGMLSLFLVIIGFSAYLGWDKLSERLETMFVDSLSNRIEIYHNSEVIARQFPLFGTGPATFAAIYQLYKEPNQEWEAYLHDDWLETRVTFGWAGYIPILLMLGIAMSRWGLSCGIICSWTFVSFIWLAMAGCFLHARFDFPLQVYSVLHFFLLLCSILFCLSRK